MVSGRRGKRLENSENIIQPLVEKLRIKVPDVWTEAVYLSGGNQQKVVLAKWLFAEQEIYIFDEPTRGIDVNAKAEFYKQMSALTKQGEMHYHDQFGYAGADFHERPGAGNPGRSCQGRAYRRENHGTGDH